MSEHPRLQTLFSLVRSPAGDYLSLIEPHHFSFLAVIIFAAQLPHGAIGARLAGGLLGPRFGASCHYLAILSPIASSKKLDEHSMSSCHQPSTDSNVFPVSPTP